MQQEGKFKSLAPPVTVNKCKSRAKHPCQLYFATSIYILKESGLPYCQLAFPKDLIPAIQHIETINGSRFFAIFQKHMVIKRDVILDSLDSLCLLPQLHYFLNPTK